MFLRKKFNYFLFGFILINFSFSENIINDLTKINAKDEAIEINTEDPEDEVIQQKCLMIVFDVFKNCIIEMKKEKEIDQESFQTCILDFFSNNSSDGELIDELNRLIKKVNKINSDLLSIENIDNEIKGNIYPLAIGMSSLSILQTAIYELFAKDNNLTSKISRGISIINSFVSIFVFKSLYDVFKIKNVKNKVLKNNSILEIKLKKVFNKLKEKITIEVEKIIQKK